MAPAEPLPPIPPFWLPPGRTAVLKGAGEVFYRDSGPETASSGTLLLLHGWTATADLNWAVAYRDLVAAGYRVIALDHRGHGRGLRSQHKFRLADCAADAAQLVRHLGASPVTLVGYSMGGAIAQLVARDHPDIADSLVLAATSSHWRGARERAIWLTMRVFQWILRMFPHRFWRGLLRRAGAPEPARDAWVLAEYSRGSADDIAEAGREIGRFDSRPWIASLRLPVAVVIPDHDRLIPPDRQRQLAASIPGAARFEADADHGDMIFAGTPLVEALLRAVADVRERRALSASPAAAPDAHPASRRPHPRPEIA